MKTILHGACLALLVLCAAVPPGYGADKVLNLYIWSEYIPEEVLAEFTKETGIKVNISTYDSNEAMYAKVKLVGKGYDLIVPSSDHVGLMRREGLLAQIDTKKIGNFQLIAPQFTNQSFDPGNSYSVPYMWGSTALVLNTGIMPQQTVQKMADLWKPELKGKLILPNDAREVMGIGLKVLGYSINEKDPEHLRQAYEKLRPLMPSVRVFDSDSPKQALLSGEVAAGLVYNGEAYIANNENKAIRYIYPPEGFSLWLDSFCIPRGAEHVEAAYRFIEYVLQPKVSALISVSMGYSSPNAKVFEFLPAAMKENSIVNPPVQDAAKGEFLDSLDEKTLKLYEQYWVKLKTK
ncbi:extracellular solute-binding protein [uncultured Desulfobulbus sp.]|uniref:extracellular solute-binding protein n=1 Tax=uncultured Desulfobulbus sp. TaxID=239745 RepID=UPI0029C6A05C|nr:extracellular solute-binding protein [uncultured Desulfobulbus sp.]